MNVFNVLNVVGLALLSSSIFDGQYGMQAFHLYFESPIDRDGIQLSS